MRLYVHTELHVCTSKHQWEGESEVAQDKLRGRSKKKAGNPLCKAIVFSLCLALVDERLVSNSSPVILALPLLQLEKMLF